MLRLCPTGVPDCSEEDLSVATALNLSWTTVLQEDGKGIQTLINSDEVTAASEHRSLNETALSS